MMYAYLDMEWLHRHNFLLFQAIFCSFAPLLTPKIKMWKKLKKTPGDVILLHMCTINQDHMHPWHDVWFLRYEVQPTELFCHLGQRFALLPPSQQSIKWKYQNWKKAPRDITILHKCTKSHDHLLSCSRDMARDGWNCYFHFGLYFFLLSP